MVAMTFDYLKYPPNSIYTDGVLTVLVKGPWMVPQSVRGCRGAKLVSFGGFLGLGWAVGWRFGLSTLHFQLFKISTFQYLNIAAFQTSSLFSIAEIQHWLYYG